MIYGLDRLNSLGGQSASTGRVRRDVNPLINTMLILEDLGDTEVMMVQVKDFGLFKDTHALGLFWAASHRLDDCRCER